MNFIKILSLTAKTEGHQLLLSTKRFEIISTNSIIKITQLKPTPLRFDGIKKDKMNVLQITLNDSNETKILLEGNIHTFFKKLQK